MNEGINWTPIKFFNNKYVATRSVKRHSSRLIDENGVRFSVGLCAT
jgi:hypothetical protein